MGPPRGSHMNHTKRVLTRSQCGPQTATRPKGLPHVRCRSYGSERMEGRHQPPVALCHWRVPDSSKRDDPGAGLTEPTGSRDPAVRVCVGLWSNGPWGTDRYAVQTVLLDQMGVGMRGPWVGRHGWGRPLSATVLTAPEAKPVSACAPHRRHHTCSARAKTRQDSSF